MNINADDELNIFEGYTHNTMLCIYQLSDPAPFQEFSVHTGGLRKLLRCERFHESVVKADRRFIAPGEKSTFVLDRVQGGGHVGLAAGYYNLQPGLATITSSFPVTVKPKALPPWSKKYNPGTLTMDILMGPYSIQNMGVH